MAKKKRSIIWIDEDKCNGCGECIPGCPEGALQIIDGKAKLVKESFCDGLGACLGYCPQGALHVEEREAEEYDAQSVLSNLEENSPELAEKHREHLKEHGLDVEEEEQDASRTGCPAGQVSCPSHQTVEMRKEAGGAPAGETCSALGNWPVKLHLIPPNARFLKNSDLVLIADCVPFAYGAAHRDFIKGNTVAAGCPKFDDIEEYKNKISDILESVNINSLTVVYMEIPCCSGFVNLVREALERSGSDIPLEIVKVGIEDEIIQREIIEV